MDKTHFTRRHTIHKHRGITPKHFLLRVAKNWYWVLPLGILGVAGGFISYKYAQAKYEVSSTILMKADEKHRSLSSLFNDLGIHKNNSNLINQIGILKSHQLTLKTLENLGWDISWFRKNLFYKEDIYPQHPFQVKKKDDFRQLEDIPIHIIPHSDEHYLVKIDAKANINGQEKQVVLDEKVAFGQAFENEYLNFTLFRTESSPITLGQEYILTFNSLGKIARTYKNNLNVTLADEDSDLVYIKLKGPQPQRGIDYLNELGKVYLQFGLDEKNKVADTTLHFINEQLESITDSLRIASEDFTDFRSKNKVVDLGMEASMILGKLEDIEKEEAIGRMKLSYYTNLQRYLNNASNTAEDLVSPSVIGITDPSLNALVLQLGKLYNEREVLSYSVQEGNPKLNDLDNEINYTKKILRENLGNLLTNTQLEMKDLEERKAQVNGLMSMLPKVEQDLIDIKRSFDLNNDLYTFLLRKRAETGIIKASNNPDASILDIARKDTMVKLGPNKIKNILLGTFLGFGIPLFGLFLLEYYDRRLKNPDEVENHLSIPIIGRVLTVKPKTMLPVIQLPDSRYAESFRKLRISLYHLLDYESHKVITIHSSISGEGKSFITANLAAALALNNKSVLLIDANLREPKLHTFFNQEHEQPGFANYLNKESSLEEIISPTSINRLELIGAGSMSGTPSDLFDDRSVATLLTSAKSRFDYIIIDTPPSRVLSEAFTMGRYSDINLLVLKMGHSHWEEVDYLNRTAQEGTLKNMTVVLNGTVKTHRS